MNRFLVTWSLVIIAGSASAGSSLQEIIEKTLPSKDKLAECFKHIYCRGKNKYFETTAIRMKAESLDTRRDFLDTIGRIIAINETIPFELDADESVSYNIYQRIYFIDSVNSLQFLINRERDQDADSVAERNKYWIVLPKNIQSPGPLMEQMFEYLWNVSIINVNILIEDSKGVVTFYTCYRFNERSCNNRTPIVHNRFINGSLQFKRPSFLPKMKNFWKCPIRYIYWDQQKDFTKTHEGLVSILAEKMNFTLENVHSPGQLGTFDANGKAFTGAFKMLKEKRGDIVTSICNQKTRRFFSSSAPHRYINILLIFRWPGDYMPVEVLFFPFDTYTWFTLFVIVAIKAIQWLLWKRFSNDHIPHRNFIAQLHIIPWLFSILILRSCYEGSVYKFLSQKLRRHPPKNIEEAIKEGFKFIVHPRLYEQLIVLDELKDSLVIIDASFAQTLDLLDKSDRNYALIDIEDSLELFARDRQRRHNYFISKEFIHFYLECYYMTKYSYLVEEFDHRLRHFFTYGHMNKLFRLSAMGRGLRTNFKKTTKGKRAVLSHLLGTFQLLVVLLGISVWIFVMELLSRRGQRLRTIMDLLH